MNWITIFERDPPKAHTTYLCILNVPNHDTRICYYEGLGSWREWPNIENKASVLMWLEIPNPSELLKERGIDVINKTC